RREQDACDIGYVRAVGNTAFIGMPGCNPTDYNPTEPQYKMTPAQIWGIDIGDKVEYRRHEGKVSGIPGNERMRYIPDNQIIGKVKGAKKIKQKTYLKTSLKARLMERKMLPSKQKPPR